MNAFIGAGVALIIAAGAAAGASAGEVKKLGEAAGWEVAVNKDMGPGCLIEKQGEGWQIQLGVDALDAQPTGYMAVFAKTKAALGEGEALPVSFEVGGKTFEGVAFGEKLGMFKRMEGYHGAWVPVNNPDFVYDLATKETMKISIDGMDPVEVSLAGTDAAFKALRECQAAQ